MMMNIQYANQTDATTHPILEFTKALDQWEEEHVVLSNKLREFVLIEEVIRLGRPQTDWYGTLRDLKLRVEKFLVELDLHAKWEDEVLFPMLADLVADSPPMIDLIEEDHRLAMQYMEAFLNELKKSISPINQQRAKEIMALLMNAHQLILDHFYGEEHYIFPLAEQLQTNIDYLSS
jgi:iron-sulfur cluster repair protein YtfE (RIC family)